MTSKDIGLTHKYNVGRVDGKTVRWCFVLEDTDPLAAVALAAYADAAEKAGYRELAGDLRAKVLDIPRRRESWEYQPAVDTGLLPQCDKRRCQFWTADDPTSTGVILRHQDGETGKIFDQAVSKQELDDPTTDIWARIKPLYLKLHEETA